MECYQCGCLEHCNAYRAELIRRKSTAKDALAKAMPVINAQKAEIEKLRAELETAVEKETFAIQEADNLRTEIEKWKYLQQHAVDVGVEQLEEIEKLKEEKGLLDAMFEMTWKADVEAIKMWREQHPDQELVIPDERKLIIWLIDQIASLKAKVRELEDDDGVKTKGFDY
jgi:regulator of replication initiation timing